MQLLRTTQCEVKPFREDEAADLIKDGAVIVYHRTAGPLCVDELFAIYPDGRITGTDGVEQSGKTGNPCRSGAITHRHQRRSQMVHAMIYTALILTRAGSALRTTSVFPTMVRKRL